MSKELVILGFPKCGTTALFDVLSERPGLTALHTPQGAKEYRWPLISETGAHTDDATIRVHKFVSYAYRPAALDYLKDYNNQARFVLCVRDPAKALVSWHGMYRRIAKSGKNTEHLAYREREFYENCTLADFYDRFAERRLRYDRHFATIMSALPKDRVAVVSQEYMARDMDATVGFVEALVNGEKPTAPAVPAATEYQGLADQSGIKVPRKIANALERVRTRLHEQVLEAGVAHLLLAPSKSVEDVVASS